MTDSTTTYTVEDYFNLLGKSGLFEDKLFEAQKLKYFGTGLTPKAVLQQMVSEHLLTTFQAKQLNERRHRGFFLSEKYKILDFLGQGGMSRVLLCEHMLLQRLVAVKILNKSLDKFPGASERFLREARASASMDHPNIARVFDVDRTGLGPCIVMEYVDGTNLHELAVKHELLDVNRVIHFIRYAAIGLQQAHQSGLVHRDIKPANLMLDRTGTIKLLDLGLARFFDPARSDNLTQQVDAASIIGTADYIAPEQVMDSSSADIRADIYSLGYTMYFLLTRVLPAGDGPVMRKLLWHQTRNPEPIRSIRQEVPEGLAAILDRMIQKKPEDRFQTPSEVVDALAPLMSEVISIPSEQEMPRTKATEYRLGLCHPPDSSKFAGNSSASSVSKETSVLSADTNSSGGSATSSSSGSTAGASSVGSTIGYDRPLGSDAIVPTGSTICAARTNEVMSASSETVATSGSSFIRSLEQPLSEIRPIARRYTLVVLLMLLASAIGGWFTLWLQIQRQTRESGYLARDQITKPRNSVPGNTSTPVEQVLASMASKGVVLRCGGSTFIKPAIEHWSKVYEIQTGAKIEYSAVGSSKGVDGLISNFLDFACSDAYVPDSKLHEFNSNLIHVPLVIGAVVPTYNLPGEAGQQVSIRFTGAVLANIYLGKIKKWNDPAITVSNLGQTLPDLDITVVHRLDGSGTTAIWTDYLRRSSSVWKDQVGFGTNVQWPIGIEAEKNDGVADAVSRTLGAIGYVELNFALANGLPVGLVKNRFGTFVQPTIDSITSAANASVHEVPDDLRYSFIDAGGANSYPIVGTCWAILRIDQVGEREAEVVRFLRWCTTEGQNHVTNLQYGRLPVEISMKANQILDRISAKP